MLKTPLQPVHAYCIGVGMLGTALLAVLLAVPPVSFEYLGTGYFWALALSVLLGELLPLKLPRRRGDGEVTISTMFSFALLLGSGLVPALTAQVAASVIQDVTARKPWWRIGFNVGQYTLALTAATGVLLLVTGRAAPVPSHFGGEEVVATMLAAAAFFIVNLVLVARATTFYEGEPLLGAFRSDLPFGLSVGAVLLCLAPMVVTVLDFSPLLFPLFFVPLIAVYRGGQQAAKAEYEATHDGLTELSNRRGFIERVERQLCDPTTHRAALLLIDLNRFKDVNDTLGHRLGDLVLRQVSPRLLGSFRKKDVVARLGSDEFAVFMADLAPERVRTAVERFLADLNAPLEVDGISIELDATVGIASYPEDGRDPDMLLQRADVAMHRAKKTQRSAASYRAEDDYHSHERLALVTDLRRALSEDRLLLHYQPQVDIQRNVAVAAEGLVRWDHPVHGLLQPGGFIDVAEHTGLIQDITYRVIELGLRDLRRWRDDGRDLSLSLNIPARSLVDRSFPHQVGRLLREHGVDGSSLTLELTESSLMIDRALAQDTMRGLTDLGAALAIDDFGTGYSSLAYLTDLPVSELKVDKSFVLGMNDDPRNEVIVRSTIELARNLGLRTVAEGIEDATTLERLVELGCQLAQGFYLSHPLPARDFVRWWDALARPAIPAPAKKAA